MPFNQTMMPETGKTATSSTGIASASYDVDTNLGTAEGISFMCTQDVHLMASSGSGTATTSHPLFLANVVYGPFHMPAGTTHLNHIRASADGTLYLWRSTQA